MEFSVFYLYVHDFTLLFHVYFYEILLFLFVKIE